MSATTNTTSIGSTSHSDEDAARNLRNLKRILTLAAGTCLIAMLAGIGLLLVDPASGSTTEAVFGFTAAIAGLATGALAIGAVIYAASRNLWQFAAAWVRWAVLGLVAVGVVRSIVGWIS